MVHHRTESLRNDTQRTSRIVVLSLKTWARLVKHNADTLAGIEERQKHQKRSIYVHDIALPVTVA